MNLKKISNYFIFLIIIIIVIYLWSILKTIEYNPNHKMKSHHDYSINGFLIFAGYTYCWGVFVFGLFQLKYYLLGKDKLQIITITYSCMIGYLLFLVLICKPIDMSLVNTGFFKKPMALIIPSSIALLYSRTSIAKKIHMQSKLEKSL